MRARNYISPDEWRLRLDECMAMVLATPERFPEATVLWARWRRTWLAESGSRVHEPAERAEVAEGEGLTGPSCEPARAGGTACATALAAGIKIGCQWSIVAPSPPATTAGSTTSAPFLLSLTGDNRNARGGRNGARAAGSW
jgi:hypothetical protein